MENDCGNKPIHECQIEWLNNAVVQSEEILKKNEKSDEVRRFIEILEGYIRRQPLICYGGTAINNILPKEAQFYGENDIADYDLYSATPLEHAKELADLYHSLGAQNVSASAGVHEGTFKVYVNFIPIADLTYLSPSIFHLLSEEVVIKDGIKYCSPDFLRMNMMVELSRPLNEPDRLEKVFLRFQLLNLYHPLKSEGTVCPRPSVTRLEKYMIPTLLCLLEQNVVFFGEFVYFNFYHKTTKTTSQVIKNVDELDVLCLEHDIVCESLKKMLTEMGAKDISVRLKSMDDEKYRRTEIYIGKHRWVTLWNPETAMNYHQVPFLESTIRIAAPETMMLYLYFFYYLGESRTNSRQRLLCMISFMLKQYLTSRKNEGIWKHFTVLCYGKPSNKREIRLKKAMKYQLLKDRPYSKEYEWFFLKYEPNLCVTEPRLCKRRHRSRRSRNMTKKTRKRLSI